MKVKIKKYFGVLPENIKPNEVYEAESVPNSNQHIVFFTTDGRRYMSNIYRSGYLNGGSWEILNEQL